MNIQENVNVLFERFEQFIKSQTIVGQEIKIGNVTIIPLANISFGIGAGGGTGKDTEGSGGGSGICAKATPTALLVVNGDDVNLVPIRKGSSFESLIESVPALIDKLKTIKDDETKKEEEA
ncbi:MAG: sporulation protein [Clostridiales bacterium]|nr:sporulation protein [Clostridiales bacterium]